MSSYVKDPASTLDYSFDYSQWLASGETINAFDVTASPGVALAPAGKPTTHNAGVVTAWVEGGTAGQRYTVTCRITTTAGRIDERSIRLLVEDR